MSKVPNLQREGKKVNKPLKHIKKRKVKKKGQLKLSEFFRTSPLADVDLSRDNSP